MDSSVKVASSSVGTSAAREISVWQGKIAVEEHVAPPALSHLITNPGWPAASFQRVLDDLADIERRLQLMDAGGVALSVLSLGSVGIQTVADSSAAVQLAAEANDAVAEIVDANPDRFAAFAALPMQDPDAAETELRRAVGRLGCLGALVNGYTDVAGGGSRYYDEPAYEPLWAAFEELDVPLYLHPRDPLPSQRRIYQGREELLGPTWAFAVETGTHALRLITSGLFDRYPGVTVIVGHLGEFLPFAIHRLEQRMSRLADIRLERSPTEVLRQNFYITTSGNYHTPSLRGCIEEVGAERLLFAADYPFEVLDDGTSWFDALELDSETKAQIASHNAAALLRIETS